MATGHGFFGRNTEINRRATGVKLQRQAGGNAPAFCYLAAVAIVEIFSNASTSVLILAA